METAEFVRGTLPQWGQFVSINAALLLFLTIWIKGMPDRWRAKREVDASSAQEWRIIADSVRGELDKCTQERGNDARTIRAMGQRIFRHQVAMAYIIQELEVLDTGSEIIRKAHAVMIAAAGEVEDGG